MNLQAGGNIALVGAQINSQGYSASAGGSYQERAAYDVKENVHIETNKRTGLGVYLADATNNTLAIATLGEQGGKTEKDRTETHIDSTRTAIVTDINAGAGAVNRNAGGFAFADPCVTCKGRGLYVDDPCPSCHGSGRGMSTRTVQARIPAGVKDGARIRLKGKGAPGERGGANGDLYVVVHVTPHPVFARKGDNLTVTVPVTFAEAALGGQVSVPQFQRGYKLAGAGRAQSGQLGFCRSGGGASIAAN